MRVLHLRASNFYGGPERQVHLHALAARGTEIEIIIASFSENGRRPELLDIADRDGISVHLFEVTSAYDRRSVRLIRDYLWKFRIDILCTHDYRTNIIGHWAVMGTSTRWVAFSRGWTRENLRIRLYHAVDKLIIRFADRIVAVSESQKQKLRRILVPEKKTFVVHNAVIPERFDAVAPVDLREKFDLAADALICVSAGRFSAEKGLPYLVKAAAEAIARNDRLCFIMFGDGPDLGQIKRLAAAAECAGRVICPGFEKDLIGCLKGADMLINSSLSEGLPNIVLEALALKIPVVATAVGGVPELIVNDHNGLLVPSRDPGALADAIVQLAGDDERRKRFAINGLESVRTAFSFETQCQKLRKIYQDVASPRSTSA